MAGAHNRRGLLLGPAREQERDPQAAPQTHRRLRPATRVLCDLCGKRAARAPGLRLRH